MVHYPDTSEPPFPHPRMPGAILLSLPLILLAFDQLFIVSVGVTAAAGVLILSSIRERMGKSVPLGVAVSLLIAAPVFFTVRFAGQGMLMALAVILAWTSYERRNDLAAGLLIALAATLKLFPLLLIVPWLLAKRYRPAGIALGGFLLFNSTGLLLPGVDLTDSIGAMLHGADVWFPMSSNGSTAAMLARFGLDRVSAQLIAIVLTIGVAMLALRLRRARVLRDPTPWLVLGVLCLPVSWISYDIVLVSAVVAAFALTITKSRYSAVVVLSVWIGVTIAYLVGSAPGTVVDTGMAAFATRVVILMGWFMAGITWETRSDRQALADTTTPMPAVNPAV